MTSQGIVDRKASGGISKITQAIDFAGSSIPVPGAGFLAGVLKLAVKKTENAVFKRKEQAIDNLTNSIDQIHKLAEKTARALTIRYYEQLCHLTTASSAELAKKAVRDIILEIYAKQNERIIIESLINSIIEQGSDLVKTKSGNNVITTTILTTILESDQIGKAKNKLFDYLAEKFRKLKTPEERQKFIEGIVVKAQKLNQNPQNIGNSETDQMDQIMDSIAGDLVDIVLENHQDNIIDYLDNPTEMLVKKTKEFGNKAVEHIKEKGSETKTKPEDNQPPVATNSKITIKWTAKGIFQEAGIKTIEGEYYSVTKEAEILVQEHAKTIASKPEVYGYRLGTKEEAYKLNLSMDSQRIRSEVVEVSLSKAANQQVKKLGDESKGNKEETELLRRQLQHATDKQVEQAKLIAKQEKEIEKEKTEREEKQEEMRRKLSLQGRQLAELTELLKNNNPAESKLSPHHESVGEEFDEEALKEAIKIGFYDKIKELSLEDKLGVAENWQIIKYAKKDAFKLVLNVADFQKRLAIKNELSAREIDVKIDAATKTVFIENIDGNNLDELLVKLESNPKFPSPSPSKTASRVVQKQDAVVNEF